MKHITIALAAAFAAASAFAAKTGSCEKEAASLKGSQTVVLTEEYDPEDKEYSDNGVYFYKVTLSKGTPFTIWVSGGAAEEMSLDVYTDFDKDYYTSFELGETDDGIQFARLAAGDWDEEDPSKVSFYVQVSGEVGNEATVQSQSSWISFVPYGSEEYKKPLTFAESQKTMSARFLDDGEYWMTARLTAGRLYRMRTTGGTAEDPVSLDAMTSSDDMEEFNVIDDLQYAADSNNVAFVIEPAETGTYFFQAMGPTNGAFTVVYEQLKARAVSAHPSTALTAANGYSATFRPGRRIASWDYADSIIDEQLFSISLAKGERWVFETTGADDFLLMQIYDSKGNIVAENDTLDGASYNVRAAVEATANATYYVGVCNAYLEPNAAVTGGKVTIVGAPVRPQENYPDEWDALDDTTAGATGLEVLPGTSASTPSSAGSTHGPHRLAASDWFDTFVIAARKDITYRVGFDFASASETTSMKLKAEVFTVSGKNEKTVVSDELAPGGGFLQFTADANAAYYVRVSAAGGAGLDYPGYNVRAVAYTESGAGLGVLTVNTFGTTDGVWTLDGEKVKYPGGSSVLLSGTHSVKFVAVKGFSTPAAQTVAVAAGAKPTVVDAYYSDTADPKDDTEKGATSWSIKSAETSFARTLWPTDAADHFAIAGKDGLYYDIELRNVEGDAVFSIVNDGRTLVKDVKSVSLFNMPTAKAKYYVVVKHGTNAKTGGGYAIAGKSSNVGAIKFSKTALSVKENAAEVKLTVNRTAKDGVVRVKYGTVAGTAKPGVDYYPQQGELVWENGDSKAKTITVRLIPDLVEHYEGNKTFKVQLRAIAAEDLAEGEYPASIVGGDACTITLTEASRPGATVESAYAAKAPKLATVNTESVPLESGTFYGVLSEDGSALTNGRPALASLTLTASAANPAALSAKLALAGKTYTFADKGWDGEGAATKTFTLVQKAGAAMYTNTLTVAVASGTTDSKGGWLDAGGTVELVMNVPDAKGAGVQEEIRYAGKLYRNNSKIQDYLTAVTNFTGYYTVALSPSGVLPVDGIPAGNGYLTVTIDNKGNAKVAGMLADGSTKPSLSVPASAIRKDATSKNGYSMYIPLYLAKSPFCFGGTLRLYADETGRVVVDPASPLLWNSDNAAATYYGEDGFEITLDPVGGWYDTLVNLQTYYLTYAFSVGTSDVSEFPAELLTAGFDVVTDVQPNETPVALAGNAFSTAKRVLVKNGRTVDLAASVNPCNVQVKLARPTGLVSGSFTIWSVNGDGTAQKEITGLKHNGVLLLSRDAASPIPAETVTAGFCTVPVNVTDENTGRRRKWTFSAPFNLVGDDQGEPDWYADDWGTPE